MSISTESGRQEVICADVAFTNTNFASGTYTISGTYAAAINIPANAVLLSGFLVIDTAFNSVTSDTFTVGDTDDDDRYKAGINGQVAGLTALVPTGTELGVGKTFGIKWTGVGTIPTAGAGRLIVEYMVDGRASFSQG